LANEYPDQDQAVQLFFSEKQLTMMIKTAKNCAIFMLQL
jgi:hypothetical protein